MWLCVSRRLRRCRPGRRRCFRYLALVVVVALVVAAYLGLAAGKAELERDLLADQGGRQGQPRGQGDGERLAVDREGDRAGRHGRDRRLDGGCAGLSQVVGAASSSWSPLMVTCVETTLPGSGVEPAGGVSETDAVCRPVWTA